MVVNFNKPFLGDLDLPWPGREKTEGAELSLSSSTGFFKAYLPRSSRASNQVTSVKLRPDPWTLFPRRSHTKSYCLFKEEESSTRLKRELTVTLQRGLTHRLEQELRARRTHFFFGAQKVVKKESKSGQGRKIETYFSPAATLGKEAKRSLCLGSGLSVKYGCFKASSAEILEAGS